MASSTWAKPPDRAGGDRAGLAPTMTADAIPGWLNAAVPVLDGQRPLELNAAPYQRVAPVLASVKSRVFA
jgi:hypothetical protein